MGSYTPSKQTNPTIFLLPHNTHLVTIVSFLFYSETSTQGKQDVTDPGSSKERKTIIGSSLSFHSVAASSISDSPFGKKTTKSPGFAGAGSTLFASQSPGGEHHDEEEHDGDHDGPYFEPIIPLPDKIDVNTGEEDDEIMF